MLTEWKKQDDLTLLNEVSCVPLQQGLRHVPSTVTVRLTPASCWYISLLVDINIHPLPSATNKVGVGLGIANLLILSNVTKITNPKTFRVKWRKLHKAQKALARKQKGSNNRYKAWLKIARIHAKIADARQDYLHKFTTQLVRENQTIVVEDLSVKNMVKNAQFALSISDASWGELVRQLMYKAEWYGRELIKIDQWFPSSKQCSNCEHITNQIPLTIREWECTQCGCNHDHDINAAKNILAAGLAVSVCGATVRLEGSYSRKAGALKQKP